MGALGDLLISLAALREVAVRWPGKKIWIFGEKMWPELIIPSQWPQVKGIILLHGKKGFGERLNRSDVRRRPSNVEQDLAVKEIDGINGFSLTHL